MSAEETRLNEGDIVVYKNGCYGDEKSNPLWGGKYGNIYGNILIIGRIACKVEWGNNTINTYSVDNLCKVINYGTVDEYHVSLAKSRGQASLNLPSDRKKGLFNL